MSSSSNEDVRIPGGGNQYYLLRSAETGLFWCLGAGGSAGLFDGVKVSGVARLPVAVKQVSLAKPLADAYEAAELRGLEALTARAHVGAVKFLAFFRGDDGDGRVRLSFVFERCPTAVPYAVPAVQNGRGAFVPIDDVGALQPPSGRVGCDLVANAVARPPLTLREAAHVTRQLLHVLAFLHGLLPPVVHRDVKPDNVLVWGAARDARTGEALLQVKLTDYGTLRRADEADLTLGQGTRNYMAPEVEMQTAAAAAASARGAAAGSARRLGGGGGGSGAAAPLPTARYDTSVDIFSVGATFFFLLTGQAPASNTRLPWAERFGGATRVGGALMAAWAARRDRKRRDSAAVAARHAAAAPLPATTAAAAAAGGAPAPAPAPASTPAAGEAVEPKPTLPRVDAAPAARDAAIDPSFAFVQGGGGGGGGGPAARAGAPATAASPARAPAAAPAASESLFSPSPGVGIAALGIAVTPGGGRPPPAPAPAAAPVGDETTILDYVFPPASPQRAFLEGLVHAAPGSSPPRRWTALEALAYMDETWPAPPPTPAAAVSA